MSGCAARRSFAVMLAAFAIVLGLMVLATIVGAFVVTAIMNDEARND